jgi:hypothetical protein
LPAGGRGEAEPLQQLPRAAAGCVPAEPVQPPDHLQVLPAGQVRVHRRVLAGQPDQPPDGRALRHHIQPRDPGPPAIGGKQGRQDPHRGRLPGPVGTEHPQHRPGWLLQVNAIERADRPETLRQALGHDRGLISHLGLPDGVASLW